MGIDAAARNNRPRPLLVLLSRQEPVFGMPQGLPSRNGGGHLDLAMSYEGLVYPYLGIEGRGSIGSLGLRLGWALF